MQNSHYLLHILHNLCLNLPLNSSNAVLVYKFLCHMPMQINNFKILHSCTVKELWNGWTEGVNTEHNYELIYQLNAIECLLHTFSSTCFRLTRPSSGAMDVKFLYIYSIWCPWCSQVSVLRSVCAGGVLHCSAQLH